MKVDIIGKKPDHKPYISFGYGGDSRKFGTLSGKDLERFAVNILKRLNSEYLR